MGGPNVTGDILSRVLRKRIQLKGSTLRTRSIEVNCGLLIFRFKFSIFLLFKYKHKLMTDFESRILPHFKNGKLKAIIDSVYEFNEIAEAHRRMESNLNVGKILLKISDEKEEL